MRAPTGPLPDSNRFQLEGGVYEASRAGGRLDRRWRRSGGCDGKSPDDVDAAFHFATTGRRMARPLTHGSDRLSGAEYESGPELQSMLETDIRRIRHDLHRGGSRTDARTSCSTAYTDEHELDLCSPAHGAWLKSRITLSVVLWEIPPGQSAEFR